MEARSRRHIPGGVNCSSNLCVVCCYFDVLCSPTLYSGQDICLVVDALNDKNPKLELVTDDNDGACLVLTNKKLHENDKFPEGLKNIFADFDEKITDILYKYQQFNG